MTFKEDLVDYEPDYSSDDGYVQSPDALSLSDNENDHIYERDEQIAHHSLESISEIPTQESYETEDEHCENEKCDNESGKCDNSENNVKQECQNQTEQKNEKCNANEVVVEEEEDNIVEEEILTDNSEQNEQLKTECDNQMCDDKSNEEEITDEEDISVEEKSVEVIEIINDTDDDLEDEVSEIDIQVSTINNEENNAKDMIENKTTTNKECTSKIDKINCRIHCLEKKNLDLITGGSKAIVNISKGPILKLRQRPCCTNQNAKPRLPVYNGLISEYGLTKVQLERRKSRKEKSAQRKREKCNRITEEKKQKEMFNEEMFCAWLKSVRQRKQNNKENQKLKCATPQVRPRPSTCNVQACVKAKTKRRPSTSPCKSCSYTTILVTPTMTIKEVVMFKKKRF